LAPAYGVTLSDERRTEKQLCGAHAMLDRAERLEVGPLCNSRTPDRRVVGVCRHFATLFVAIARRKQVLARARCGFANYFEAGKHFDHWVAEYWNEQQQRWILVDAQIDDVQARLVRPPFDVRDVPRDRFLVAGDAWSKCRNGSADPKTFGVAGTDWAHRGVRRRGQTSSLQKIELLPWGWYGLATATAPLSVMRTSSIAWRGSEPRRCARNDECCDSRPTTCGWSFRRHTRCNRGR
jgi:hypothetical protein